MAEIRRLIDERTYGRLQALKEKLPNGKETEQGASSTPRPVRTKTNERRSGVGGQTTTTNKRRRRGRRRRNEKQAEERTER